jgi:hypothetical protein
MHQRGEGVSADLGAWMREHLGYLGWHEEPHDYFWRESPPPVVYAPRSITPPVHRAWRCSWSTTGFRLEVRATESGAVAIAIGSS